MFNDDRTMAGEEERENGGGNLSSDYEIGNGADRDRTGDPLVAKPTEK
jgi:hypothetical protein